MRWLETTATCHRRKLTVSTRACPQWTSSSTARRFKLPPIRPVTSPQCTIRCQSSLATSKTSRCSAWTNRVIWSSTTRTPPTWCSRASLSTRQWIPTLILSIGRGLRWGLTSWLIKWAVRVCIKILKTVKRCNLEVCKIARLASKTRKMAQMVHYSRKRWRSFVCAFQITINRPSWKQSASRYGA